MKKIIGLLFLVILSSANTTVSGNENTENPPKHQPPGDEVFKAISQFLEYDRKIPFDAKIVETKEMEHGTREKIVFTGLYHSRVPGYLATPNNGKAKHPLIFLVSPNTGHKKHWFQRHSFHQGIKVTNILLQAGFAVMTLDAVYHGERSAEIDYAALPKRKDFRYTKRDMDFQTAKEYRRAMDYLETRTDIDTRHFGMLGYSMGGRITLMLSTVEPRIKVAVVAVAPGYFFPNKAQSEAFMMLAANRDKRPIDTYRANFDLIPTTQKKFVEYDSGHELPPEHADVATDWLIEHLK